MMTYYCPLCWAELAKDTARCSRCGASLGEVDQEEEKLCHNEPVAQQPSHATPQGQRQVNRSTGSAGSTPPAC